MSGLSIQPRPFQQVYEEFDVTKASRLGAGGFGKVYKIKHKVTGRKYAAKYQKLHTHKMRTVVQEEAAFLKLLSNGKRVVEIYDYYEKDKHSLMVIEYLEGGELFSVVGASDYTLTESKCVYFTIEIVKALNYIHEHQIIHLDLKPQNIMLKNKKDAFKIKLIDFGLAKRLEFGQARTGFVGTVGFMAPEVANAQYKQDYASPASDFFSLGVIVYMLVSGGLEPFWDGNDIRAIKNTLKKEVSFHREEFGGVSREAKDLIQRLLVKDQMKRLSGREVLDHSWFRYASNMRRSVAGKDTTDGYRFQSTPLDTTIMRRFVARHRWMKAIKAVRFMIKVTNQFQIPDIGEH